MPRGEKLFKFLASLMMRGFYGNVTIRLEAGKVTHVETETRRTWQYKDLPEGRAEHSCVAVECQIPLQQ
jgi:hypothetical protein